MGLASSKKFYWKSSVQIPQKYQNNENAKKFEFNLGSSDYVFGQVAAHWTIKMPSWHATMPETNQMISNSVFQKKTLDRIGYFHENINQFQSNLEPLLHVFPSWNSNWNSQTETLCVCAVIANYLSCWWPFVRFLCSPIFVLWSIFTAAAAVLRMY